MDLGIRGGAARSPGSATSPWAPARSTGSSVPPSTPGTGASSERPTFTWISPWGRTTLRWRPWGLSHPGRRFLEVLSEHFRLPYYSKTLRYRPGGVCSRAGSFLNAQRQKKWRRCTVCHPGTTSQRNRLVHVRVPPCVLYGSASVTEPDRRFPPIRGINRMKKATLKEATISGAVGRSSL